MTAAFAADQLEAGLILPDRAFRIPDSPSGRLLPDVTSERTLDGYVRLSGSITLPGRPVTR